MEALCVPLTVDVTESLPETVGESDSLVDRDHDPDCVPDGVALTLTLDEAV